MNVIFDMETADPDDLLTLCFLSHNPKATLIGVTVTPGTPEQIGMIRTACNHLHIKVPIGSRNPEHRSDEPSPMGKYVSKFYYDLFGQKDIYNGQADGFGYQVIADCFQKFGDFTLLTGAPLHNLRRALEMNSALRIKRWVAQGGFAGDSVVPVEHRLDKFAGKETCPTFNFNGDPKGALLALSSDQIEERVLVSKNVCHSVTYDESIHKRYESVKEKNPGARLIYKAMSQYLQKHDGKMLHDPLAACVMLDESICEYRSVDVYRSKGEWGSKLNPNSKTKISISVDRERYYREFMFGE